MTVSMRPHRTLVYAVTGQIGWFVCVLSAAHNASWIGIAFVTLLVACHLREASMPSREARLVINVILAATLWETGLIHAGLIQYPHGAVLPGVVPPWLLGLWALFAIQLNVLFRWLRGRPWLAAVLGAIAGPLSFRAGVALGAASFPDTHAAMVVLAAGWAIWMPVLGWMSKRSDGIHPLP